MNESLHPTLTDITKSSNIAGSAHDGKALFVAFKGGVGKGPSVYRYDGAPAQHHDGIQSAESAGRYFQEHIRHNFAGVKVV